VLKVFHGQSQLSYLNSAMKISENQPSMISDKLHKFAFLLGFVLFLFVWLKPEIGHSHKYNTVGTLMLLLGITALRFALPFTFKEVFLKNINSPSFFAIFGLLLIGIVQAIFENYDQSRSYTRWVLYFSLFIIFLVIHHARSLGILSHDSLSAILLAFVWLHWFLILYALYVLPGWQIGEYFSGDLLSNYFSNVRAFGKLNWLISFACMYLFFGTSKHWLKGIFLVTFFSSVMAIVYSGGRGAMIAVLAMLFFGVLAKYRFSFKVFLMVLPFCFGILFLGYIVIDGRGLGSFYRFLLYSSGRVDVWWEAIGAGLHYFWFGLGPEAFKGNPLIPIFGKLTNPHNAFIQVFLEFGAIGLLLLSVPLFKMALFTFDGRNWRSKEKVLLMSFSFSWFVYSLIDGVAYHFFPLSFNIVILAYMFSREVD
jgi:hypothetical protein